MIDRFRVNLNGLLPGRVQVEAHANPKLAQVVATGHSPERVHRWLSTHPQIDWRQARAGVILLRLAEYAEEVAESDTGPESRPAAEVLTATGPPCDHGTPHGQRCALCANPGGIPRQYPDAPPLKPETSAARDARKRAEYLALAERQSAERAAKKAERDAALAGDPLMGGRTDRPRMRPPTEAEATAAALAAPDPVLFPPDHDDNDDDQEAAS